MSATNGRRGFIGAMVSWLNRRFAPAGRTIAADTPLFADGLINSIRILEIIAWTEQRIGRQIPDTSIRMDNFRTVESIARAFIPEEAHAGD
jgi:acyl carrier protein